MARSLRGNWHRRVSVGPGSGGLTLHEPSRRRRFIHAMFTCGEDYAERNVEHFESERRNRKLRPLQCLTRHFNLALVAGWAGRRIPAAPSPTNPGVLPFEGVAGSLRIQGLCDRRRVVAHHVEVGPCRTVRPG